MVSGSVPEHVDAVGCRRAQRRRQVGVPVVTITAAPASRQRQWSAGPALATIRAPRHAQAAPRRSRRCRPPRRHTPSRPRAAGRARTRPGRRWPPGARRRRQRPGRHRRAPVQPCGRDHRVPGERALPAVVAEAVTPHPVAGPERRTRAGPGNRAHQIPAHDNGNGVSAGKAPDRIRVSTGSTATTSTATSTSVGPATGTGSSPTQIRSGDPSAVTYAADITSASLGGTVALTGIPQPAAYRATNRHVL